jgi:autotransporter-associated beta strand protein
VFSSIAGSDLITKAGLGSLTLSGFNSSTGSISVQGGTLIASGGTAIGDTQALTFPALGDTMTFSLPSGTETIGNLSGGNTGTHGGSTVSIGSGAALTINQTGATTYSGLITGGATSTLVKAGSAILTVASTTTFAGALVINQGQLSLTGNVAQFASLASLTLNGPTSILLDQQDQSSSNDRLANAATVTLNNTAAPDAVTTQHGFYLNNSSQAATRAETVGAMTLGAGQNVVTAQTSTTTSYY